MRPLPKAVADQMIRVINDPVGQLLILTSCWVNLGGYDVLAVDGFLHLSDSYEVVALDTPQTLDRGNS